MMVDEADKAYSDETPHGPTLEELAGTGQAPPGDGNAPATGVASAAGGGAIDASIVGTNTEVLGAGSDGGVGADADMQDRNVDAVTGTGAGAGTGELDTMQDGTAQPDREDGAGGASRDQAARDSTTPSADTDPNLPA